MTQLQSQSPVSPPTPEQERQLFEGLTDPYHKRALELRAAVYGFETLEVNQDDAPEQTAYVRPAKIPEFYEIESVERPAESAPAPAGSKRQIRINDLRSEISEIHGSQN